MKKVILSSVLALVFSLAFEPTPNAQMAKEGTVSCTRIGYATPGPPLDLDGTDKEERYAVTFEASDVILNDTGIGPFHNMSVRSCGVGYFDKGEWTEELVYGVWVDPDGDKVFFRLTVDPKETTRKFLGGTGKFAGIEGSWEPYGTKTFLKPAKEGANTLGVVVPTKIHYKLP